MANKVLLRPINLRLLFISFSLTIFWWWYQLLMVVLLWCPWCYLRFLYFDAINTLQYLSCFFLLSWPRCSIDSCVHNSSTNFFALHHQLCTMQWVFGITTLTLFVIGLYFVLLHHPQTQEIFLPACDLFWLLCHALMVVSLSHGFSL